MCVCIFCMCFGQWNPISEYSMDLKKEFAWENLYFRYFYETKFVCLRDHLVIKSFHSMVSLVAHFQLVVVMVGVVCVCYSTEKAQRIQNLIY